MKIIKELLPIKGHFFFFMASMGPILPQLPVFGKELGISSVVMGTITGTLPIIFLLAKPTLGMIVDIFRNQRKIIFMLIIFCMSTCFAFLFLLPNNRSSIEDFGKKISYTCEEVSVCNKTTETDFYCKNKVLNVMVEFKCNNNNFSKTIQKGMLYKNEKEDVFCYNAAMECYSSNCSFLNFREDLDVQNNCLYGSVTFWAFLFLLSLGTICYNVANSISDAICFDVIGDKYEYGKQRVLGSIGFGTTALIGGFLVDWWTLGRVKNYVPVFIIMIVFTVIDLLTCTKLKLPIIAPPKNIIKDLYKLLRNVKIVVFLTFAILAGVIDSFIIYFLFWYVEDFAYQTDTKSIKLLEGLIVAAETLGGEILFFIVAGKILTKIGYANCFSVCFINYGIRLLLISLAPSPWYILPIELVMQGPTYALTYTTIVAYANEIAPPGMSATMQGIAAGLDDGFGYAIGCMTVGVLYETYGGSKALQIFSALAFFCGAVHFTIQKILNVEERRKKNDVEYKAPEEAIQIIEE